MAEEDPAEDSLYADTDEDVACLSSNTLQQFHYETTVASSDITVENSTGNSIEFSKVHINHLDTTCVILHTNKHATNMRSLKNSNDTSEKIWRSYDKFSSPSSSLVYKPNYHVSRYSSSMKHFIPIRKSDKSKEVMPLDQAGFFSFITYDWLTPYMKQSYKHGLQAENVPVCSTKDRCDHSSQRLEHMWKEEVLQKGLMKASLQQVVCKFIQTRVLVDMFLYLISLTLGFLGPIFFMRRLLEFCEDENAVWWHGALWALGMAGSELIRVLFFGMTWGVAYRTGIRLRSAVIAMLYKKIMRLSTLGDKSIGELINLFANDGQKIYDFVVLGPMIIGGPFVALIGTGYILWLLGPSAIFGMLTFILFYPIQYVISTMAARISRKRVRITDQRIRLMNELLICVKLIKMYAWEKPFFQTVREIRQDEQRQLELAAFIHSISAALAPVIPIVAVIITFLVYISSGNDLSPAEAFTVWCIMDIISIPGYVIPTAVSSTVEMRLTLNRIESILCMDEIKSNYNKPTDRSIALSISNASFFWHCKTAAQKNTNEKPYRKSNNGAEKEPLQQFHAQHVACLVDISIIVPKGRLLGICGTVAAGKTSLLSAVLGQLKLENGQVSVDGSFALVSQQAWIMNCSLRDNILFGETFDAKKYYNVIHACALGPDMAELPFGDETEIGERGVNLSGGQRQRVAIARALYADKDVYLLDDPLSAVDVHVAQHIFDKCILGVLKLKTVLFVTHQLQFLSRCDEIVFMDEGRIKDQGPHIVLVDRNEQYSSLIKTFLHENKEIHGPKSEIQKEVDNKTVTIFRPSKGTSASSDNIDKKIDLLITPKNTCSSESSITEEDNADNNVLRDNLVKRGIFQDVKRGHLIQEEAIEVGSVPVSTYLIYIQYAGGFLVSLIALIFFVINVGSTAMSSWWLAHWLNTGVTNSTRIVRNETETYTSLCANPDLNYYETVYGIFILVILVSCVCRSFVFIKACLRASSQFHHRLFLKVFASPMRFFDSTPVGRLLNIFSRDMDETDCRLPTSIEAFIQNLLFIVASIGLIVFVFPWFLVALVLFASLFFFFSRIFRSAIRDLKRLENTSRSPIYSHVAATVNGLNTIHAFGKEREFISKFMYLYDENTSSFFLFNCSMRWLAVRLDMLSAGVVGITAVLVVIFHGYIPAAFAGLALAYSGQLSGMLQYSVRLATETESRFMSVQRMHTYLQTLESENFVSTENRRPPSNWPHMGAISFCNVKMRYQKHLPLVIKDISFNIEPQEKIGIVGRTGSGKSSLGGCLFRLVELCSGTVKIDGINIAEINLEDLRSKLSIIPQDPVLFVGTVRFNLDPFKKHSDEAIWNALERTNMKNKIKMFNGQLEGLVVENGENFSVGERQLICMARALLRRSKVLVLDEATAAIDTQTDAILQSTLRDAFRDCTVLTIAHRLNTVLNSDRILVLEDGKVVEFDQPSVLLSDEKSSFFKMVTVMEATSQSC